MKADLATSIVVAIVGILVSYFACNYFFGPIEPVTVNSVDSSQVNASYDEPNVEVFNYRALNPTVEVYVGNCTELNERGECIDNQGSQ